MSRSLFVKSATTRPGLGRCGGLRAIVTLLPAVVFTTTLHAQQPTAARPAGQAPARITQVGPGPTNSITDVPGLLVGQYSKFGDGYRSGTTVILSLIHI